MTDTLHQLTRLEQSLHDPAVRHDSSAVDALLAEDFKEFGASGRIWARDEVIALLASDAPSTITGHDFQCRLLSPHVALLTYVSALANDGRQDLRSSLWRMEAGSWRMVFHQGTPIL